MACIHERKRERGRRQGGREREGDRFTDSKSALFQPVEIMTIACSGTLMPLDSCSGRSSLLLWQQTSRALSGIKLYNDAGPVDSTLAIGKTDFCAVD